MEATNKRVRIGTLYMPSGYASVLDHFFARATDRQAFSEGEKERLTPSMRKMLEEQIQAILGDKVTDVKLTYSLRAGCSCPCSPGFCISAVPTGTDRFSNGQDYWWQDELLAPTSRDFPARERATIFLQEDRTLDVRTHEVQWRSNRGLGRRRGGKEYVSKKLFSWILPGGRVAVKPTEE
jgi:hypothetical protein